MTCAVCTGRGHSGSQVLHEEPHEWPVPITADSSVPAFPMPLHVMQPMVLVFSRQGEASSVGPRSALDSTSA